MWLQSWDASLGSSQAQAGQDHMRGGGVRRVLGDFSHRTKGHPPQHP